MKTTKNIQIEWQGLDTGWYRINGIKKKWGSLLFGSADSAYSADKDKLFKDAQHLLYDLPHFGK